MEDLINEQILENIYEEIQENYPNLSEQDQQQLTYKTFEEKSQWLSKNSLKFQTQTSKNQS